MEFLKRKERQKALLVSDPGEKMIPGKRTLFNDMGKLAPGNFITAIDSENNSPSYLPLSTVNHINYKRSKPSYKKVYIIWALTTPNPKPQTSFKGGVLPPEF